MANTSLQKEVLPDVTDLRVQENTDRFGKQIQKQANQTNDDVQAQISDLQDQIQAIRTFLGI